MSAAAAFALMWVGFVAYLSALILAPRLDRRVVWGAILVLVLGFAVAPVLLSHDVFSYVGYARLGVLHELDPYAHPPAAAPGDPVYPRVEWTEATSAYGPLFTLASYPLAWLSVGGAVAAFKGAAALSVLGLAALVARLAPLRGVDSSRAAACVALNPLVLVHVVGGAHNDALAMGLATLGVAGALAARDAMAGVAIVAAAAVKASAAVVAPFALLAAARPVGREPTRRVPGRGSTGRLRRRVLVQRSAARMLAGGAVGLGTVCLAAYAGFGWDWLGALGLAGENQNRTSYMSVPIATARLTGTDPTPVRAAGLVLYGALLLGLLAWTWRGGDWVRAAAWASLGLLLATSWLLPWYLIWALPLVALSRDRPLQLLLLGLTAYQLGARIPL